VLYTLGLADCAGRTVAVRVACSWACGWERAGERERAMHGKQRDALILNAGTTETSEGVRIGLPLPGSNIPIEYHPSASRRISNEWTSHLIQQRDPVSSTIALCMKVDYFK
jgi:hypothetical protein